MHSRTTDDSRAMAITCQAELDLALRTSEVLQMHVAEDGMVEYVGEA